MPDSEIPQPTPGETFDVVTPITADLPTYPSNEGHNVKAPDIEHHSELEAPAQAEFVGHNFSLADRHGSGGDMPKDLVDFEPPAGPDEPAGPTGESPTQIPVTEGAKESGSAGPSTQDTNHEQMAADESVIQAGEASPAQEQPETIKQKAETALKELDGIMDRERGQASPLAMKALDEGRRFLENLNELS